MAPVELVGATVHPRWCRLGCDGDPHRSPVLRHGDDEVDATATADWRIEIRVRGSRRSLRRHIRYLLCPAGNGR